MDLWPIVALFAAPTVAPHRPPLISSPSGIASTPASAIACADQWAWWNGAPLPSPLFQLRLGGCAAEAAYPSPRGGEGLGVWMGFGLRPARRERGFVGAEG